MNDYHLHIIVMIIHDLLDSHSIVSKKVVDNKVEK
jgi:hypothetical protein